MLKNWPLHAKGYDVDTPANVISFPQVLGYDVDIIIIVIIIIIIKVFEQHGSKS